MVDSVIQIDSPFKIFYDIDGNPLEDGYIYIGQSGLDPISNPITVYSDNALTLPIAQPLRTMGGYPMLAGTPTNIYAPLGFYSITVLNKRGTLIYTDLVVEHPNNLSGVNFASLQEAADSDLSGLDSIETVSFYDGWASSLDGPLGGARYFIDGSSGAASTIYTDLSGFFDSNGNGYSLSRDQDINVYMFGCYGNNVNDDHFALQSAINYVGINGGILFLHTGIFRISQALVIQDNYVFIQGSGLSSKIKTTSSTADIFTVNQTISCMFSDFAVWTSVEKTAGSAFGCFQIARSKWENVFIGAPEDVITDGNWLFSGIDLDQFDYCVIENCHILTKADGIACNGDASSLFGAGLFIDGGTKIAGQDEVNSAGVHIGGGAGGIYFNDVDIILSYFSVRISTARQPAVINREVFLGATCSLDGPLVDNIVIEASSCTHLDVSGTWIASAGVSNSFGVGINVAAPNADLVATYSGVRLYNNGGGGAILNAGSHIFSGGVIYNNGAGSNVTLASGYGNGIWISNVAASLFVEGTSITSNGKVSESAGYGIKLTNGMSFFKIAPSSLLGNVQGAFLYGGTFDNNRVLDASAGFDTQASGVATITNGNSSVVINHNLDHLAVAGIGIRFSITPVGNSPESGLYWTSLAGASTFTLNLGTTATRNNDFYWQAEGA